MLQDNASDVGRMQVLGGRMALAAKRWISGANQISPDEKTGQVALRAYELGDAVRMYELDRVCFAEAFRFNLRAMREFAEGAKAVVVLAEAAGVLVGFAIGEVDGDVMYLVTLDVDPASRRRGVAGKMLGWLEARARGARRMALHVHADNAGAIRFYEREGFTVVDRVSDFYGWEMDAVVYAKDFARGTHHGDVSGAVEHSRD